MGYRSDVSIMCTKKVWDLLNDSMANYNEKNEEYSPFKPHSIKTDGENYLLQWFDVKWYSNFEDVQSVEKVLNKVGDEHDDDEDYAYKQILIGEDGATNEYGNSAGFDLFDIFYVVPQLEGTDTFEEI